MELAAIKPLLAFLLFLAVAWILTETARIGGIFLAIWLGTWLAPLIIVGLSIFIFICGWIFDVPITYSGPSGSAIACTLGGWVIGGLIGLLRKR